MRVLHIYKSFYPDTLGGVEELIKNLSFQTNKLGVQNSLLTVSDQPKSIMQMDFLRVTAAKKTFEAASCPVSLGFLQLYRKSVRDADILHFHYPWPFGEFTEVILKSDKPIVVTYHSDIIKQKLLRSVYTPFMHAFLARAKAIVATSENYAHSSPILSRYVNKTKIIPVGIPEQSSPSLETINDWQNKVGKEFYLFIGVLRYYKGLSYLLEAAMLNQLPLVIAGAGPMQSQLEKLIQANPQACKNIFLLGKVSEADKLALIALSKAIILPSHLRSEAFGICLLEGLRAGKPLISTELNTGTSFVNQHNKTGLVVPPADTQALAEAMQKLSDTELSLTFGQAARQQYLQHFTLDVMANSYFDLYSKVLSK